VCADVLRKAGDLMWAGNSGQRRSWRRFVLWKENRYELLLVGRARGAIRAATSCWANPQSTGRNSWLPRRASAAPPRQVGSNREQECCQHKNYNRELRNAHFPVLQYFCTRFFTAHSRHHATCRALNSSALTQRYPDLRPAEQNSMTFPFCRLDVVVTFFWKLVGT